VEWGSDISLSGSVVLRDVGREKMGTDAPSPTAAAAEVSVE
jgi:hypothetical protein